MNWLDYREKLGIGFSDEEKAKMFIVRIENFFTLYESDIQLNRDDIFYFCNTVGFPFKDDDYFILSEVLPVFDIHKKSIKDYISCLCAFINSVSYPIRQKLIEWVEKSLKQCSLKYEVYKNDYKYFVYPLGVKLFDEKLINNVLDWLIEYPKTFETFKIALEQYNNKIYIRDIADNLRKSLEVFFQEFFNNLKNLDNNIQVVGAYLKEQNADEELRNMLVILIKSYKVQNDKIAKHNDRIDEKFLEFLLYQTGIFIRMLMVVKNNESKE